MVWFIGRGAALDPSAQQHSPGRSTPLQARPELFPYASIIDDGKNKVQRAGKEAAREFDVLSDKAQARTGRIELYSSKYYAACTFGGLMSCVCGALPLSRIDS